MAGQAVGRKTDLQPLASRLGDWMWTKALPLWWRHGADHAAGGFHESLRHDLAPTHAPRRARVQARQTHVYALAGLAGWPGPWGEAVEHGLSYLSGRYFRTDGLYRALVDAAGAPVDETAILYDQAFVLLALASAARAVPGRAAALAAEARALERAIRQSLSHGEGGFRAGEGEPAFLANPIMHLFESALAWIEAEGGAVWHDLADELAALFLGRLFQAEGGRIREVFDAHWRPAEGLSGRILEPGHHFEWAWLIQRWARLRGDAPGLAAARLLYEAANRGVDPASGLVMDELLDDFSIHRASSRPWPQTERVKAALLNDDPRAARQAADAMALYLQTPHAGLWREIPSGQPAPGDEIARASSFYHFAGAILALREASGPP